MGKFVKGEVVVLNFPFSDLSGAKRRPALVLADLCGDDVILCQITSFARTDEYAVSLSKEDFANGSLSVESVIRPNRIFTADESLILYSACKVKPEKTSEVIDKIIKIIKD
jgi:mRNA interferase MazF